RHDLVTGVQTCALPISQQAEARHALLVAAGLVILATTVRGLLMMSANYQAEYVSQRVAYQYRLDFFSQLQRLSFGFHDKIHSGEIGRASCRGRSDMEVV